jgi:hypothetical protein
MSHPTLRGFSLAWRRLTRRPPALAFAIATGFVVLVALSERSHGGPALVRVLSGAALGLAVPLASLALFGVAVPEGRIDLALLPLSRRGLDRRRAALGFVLALAAAAGAMGTILAVVAALVAALGAVGPTSPALLGSLGTAAALGAAAGVTYLALIALGSSWGERGGGRWSLLLLDALLGTATGTLALPWPRAHLRNLLGASAVLDLPQSTAPLALALIVGVCVLGTLARVER